MRISFGATILVIVLASRSAAPDSQWIQVTCKDASSEYYRSVQTLLYSNWAIPEGVQGVECLVQIEVDQDGVPRRLDFDSCPKNQALRESVRRAVHDTAPIPLNDIEQCRRYPIGISFLAPAN